MTIEQGEFVAIIGLSGAGKSTFLRSINRLVPITEGDIRVDGKSVTKANKKELRLIRRQIGLISQSFNLVKRSTVQKNVLSGRLGYYGTWKSILGLFTKEDYERTKDCRLVRQTANEKRPVEWGATAAGIHRPCLGPTSAGDFSR